MRRLKDMSKMLNLEEPIFCHPQPVDPSEVSRHTIYSLPPD